MNSFSISLNFKNIKHSYPCFIITLNVLNTVYNNDIRGCFVICRFFSLLTVYCGLGSAINVCLGKKGKEIIPNSGMWTNLPGYTKVLYYYYICSMHRHKNLLLISYYDKSMTTFFRLRCHCYVIQFWQIERVLHNAKCELFK